MPYTPASSLNRTALGVSFSSIEDPAAQIKPITCLIHGRWHSYQPHVIDSYSVVLTCECGDVKWVDRPKPEAK